MIGEDVIARVRESLNIAEIVREFVPTLKRSGRNFSARCPFHQEKTPSFNVNPEMGLFKCFGCGVGGDAFKFLMLTQGLTYPEAIRRLAERVGITIEEETRHEASAESQERQTLYEVLENAARFYHRHLLESPESGEARQYLQARGLTPETLDKFVIGFAPASGFALRDAASRKGWSLETLEKAGLLRKRDTGRLTDNFWNRIIFPIWDAQGRIIAFGGRVLGDGLPKYINSPETAVYSKSRHLYGLYQALPVLRQRRHAVILEGYMDVVTCHQFDLSYSVATLGTALTDDHVRTLKRHAERVTLLFDPDAAGAQAALRGGEMLLAEGFTVDVVTLPDELDADEILLRDGRLALESHLDSATPFMEYLLQQTMSRHPSVSPEGKSATAREILPVIRRVKDPLLQDQYLARLGEVLRVEKSVLVRQLSSMKVRREQSVASEPAQTVLAGPTRAPVYSVEEELIIVALMSPGETIAASLDNVVWDDEKISRAWPVLRDAIAAGSVPVAELASHLSETDQVWLSALAMEQRVYPRPLESIDSLLAARERLKEQYRLNGLQAEIALMIEGKAPMNAEKVQIFNELNRRLKGSVAQ